MLILAFETSAVAASVALHDGTTLLAQAYQNSGLTHSRTLMVMAQDILKQCDRAVTDVTAVAVAQGPGSFTGVRIGMAAAKGFAWGNNLPCYGVSTTEAMACALGIHRGYICAVMDARRSQVYNALFHADCGKLTRITEDRAISLQNLGEDVKKLDDSVFLVGDGSVLCYNTLSDETSNLILLPEHRRQQRAVGVALVAAQKIARGEEGSALSLAPNYLRLSQAEREKLEKHGKL